MKFALLSETLPPAKTGQAMVLYRLLQGFDAGEYCLISRSGRDEDGGAPAGLRLPGRYFQVAPRLELTRGHRAGLARVREHLNLATGILTRARQVAEIVKREGCEAVVACTGDLTDLPAGYVASRRAGVPFYAIIYDHFSHREWSSGAKRFWARRLEPLLLRGAAGVVAPNETLRDELRRQYGVEAAVIRNSFDISPYEALGDAEPAPGGGGGRIVYTGDIYEAHYDAFRNLLDALGRPGLEGLSLHAYTPRTAEELARAGVRGDRLVLHAPRPPSEIPAIQRGAWLLFLPLAFNSPYPELIRTSATNKVGEYMAARRPVLVHAPEGSFVSWYFREHGCGVVVDRDDPAELAQALAGLLADEGRRQDMVERGWERVRSDFRVETAREQFRELLAGGRGRGGARARA